MKRSEKNSAFFNSRITRKMLINLVAFSTILFLLATILQVIVHYRRGQVEIFRNLHDTLHFHEPTFARSIWTYDRSQLQVEALGLLQRPFVNGVEIFDEDGSLLVQAGLIESESSYRQTQNIFHQDEHIHRPIGKVTLYGSDSQLISNLSTETLEFTLSNLVRSFLVTLFMALFFQRTIIFRIKKLHEAIISTSAYETLNPSEINALINHKTPDELDELLLSFKESRRKLNKSFDELQEKQQDLKIANNAKTSFLAMVSHEMRTPLTNIINRASLTKAEDRLDEEFTRDTLDTIQDSGEHLLRLINDIIEYISFKNDNISIQPVPTAIEDIVSGLESLFSPKAQDAGIDLRVKTSPEKMPLLLLDPMRINQILINLLNNAIRFTKKGFVGLSVDYEKDREQLTLEVSDSGPGISSEILDKITRPFYQLENSIDRSHGGLGLGLAIVNKLVTTLSGKMKVTSENRKGTIFSIRFPVEAVKTASSSVSSGRYALPPKELTEKKSKVLVVDDDAHVRFIVVAIIKHLGFTDITSVASGAEALEAMDHHDYQLVLLDIQMPNMNGWELARQYKLRFPEKRRASLVVALTALSRLEFEAKTQSGDFDALVGKPIAANELQDLLSKSPIFQ